jgi:DNA-binding IclR family transcriptional regulator
VGRPRQTSSTDSPAPRIWLEADRQAAHVASSLGRGLMILRAFEIGDSCLGNTTLAERTGFAKATVSRLTQILTDLGYLRYRGDLGKYELAPSVLGLCHPYLGNMPVPNVARPYMLQLAKETHANVGLGIQDGLSMVYVESALGEPMSGRRQRVGFSVPLALTAMGLACIGGMAAERREVVLRQIRQTASTREWRAISTKVDEAVAQVHARGFYLGVGTLSPMTNMLGVPFTHDGGQTMMAFNCGGSSPLQTAQKLGRFGPKLVTLAAKVRSELATQQGA